MSNSKQIEIIRKRNNQLSKELEDLKNKIKLNENIDAENMKQAQDLIEQLKSIKNQWNSALKDIEKCRDKYNELIEILYDIDDIFFEYGFIKKVPWYKKLLVKFKNK